MVSNVVEDQLDINYVLYRFHMRQITVIYNAKLFKASESLETQVMP